MATLAPLPQAPSTATDFAALAELRARAGGEGGAEVTRETARQFEALFVQMMLKSMREAGAAFGDGSDTTYRDLFDQQIAVEITRGRGLGVAEMLARQLEAGSTQKTPALRAPGTADVVPALTAAPPSPPPARFQLSAPDDTALLASASAPAFAPDGPTTARATDTWQDWRPASPEEFIRDLWPHAERAGSELGVDPRAIVAQAALETGWGRHVARDAHGTSGNNLFNIKADTRWSGARLAVRTLEFRDGLPRQEIAAFRAYPDLPAAFDDYVGFLRGNPRYAEALTHGAEPGRFAEALQAAGYATDPGYADKLRSILASPRFGDLVGALKNPAGMPRL